MKMKSSMVSTGISDRRAWKMLLPLLLQMGRIRSGSWNSGTQENSSVWQNDLKNREKSCDSVTSKNQKNVKFCWEETRSDGQICRKTMEHVAAAEENNRIKSQNFSNSTFKKSSSQSNLTSTKNCWILTSIIGFGSAKSFYFHNFSPASSFFPSLLPLNSALHRDIFCSWDKKFLKNHSHKCGG